MLVSDLIIDPSFSTGYELQHGKFRKYRENAKEVADNLKVISYNLKDSSNLAGVLFNDEEAAANLKNHC